MICTVANPHYTTFRFVKHVILAKANIEMQFMNYDGKRALFECFSVYLYKVKYFLAKNITALFLYVIFLKILIC